MISRVFFLVLDMELVDLIMVIMAVVYSVTITAKPAGFLVEAEILLPLGQAPASWAGLWQEWPLCLCTIGKKHALKIYDLFAVCSE